MTNFLKIVEEVYKSLRQWENEFPKPPPTPQFESLKNNLISLAQAEALEIRKLADLSSRLRQDLALKDLVNLIIPFERALQKSLRDDEFMILEGDRSLKTETFPLILILENIRSAFNVGSFFRTAEALGAQEIILCGYTPTPENEKIKKTTMGTEAWIQWKSAENLEGAFKDVKRRGFKVIAVETAPKAISINEIFFRQPTAFVFGNERFGLGLTALQTCDEIRKVELSGQKNSLNVGTCGAIVCHEWIRQWKTTK